MKTIHTYCIMQIITAKTQISTEFVKKLLLSMLFTVLHQKYLPLIFQLKMRKLPSSK